MVLEITEGEKDEFADKGDHPEEVEPTKDMG